VSASTPQICAAPLGRVLLDHLGQRLVVRCAVRDEVVVDEVAGDDLVQDAVVEGDVGAGLDLAVDVGVVGDPLAARVDDDQRRPRRRACLKKDEATGWLAVCWCRRGSRRRR
jgi:hypothetical protein